jgi:crotonobetainyl-CoA:carnitine CoA-transferase CaiB-like acyl-CoA transferase
VVYRCSDLYVDPQLQHRQYFVELDHPAMGRTRYDGLPHRLSRTPATLRPAPVMGQHNGYVLKEILGLSDAKISRLIETGVVY